MLAARHRARLTMQDRDVDLQERIRPSVRRRLFQDEENETGNAGNSLIEKTRERNDDDKSQGRNEKLDSGVEENAANFVLQEIRAHREEAKRRWNFDFVKGIPLPGIYEWSKVDKYGNEIPINLETGNPGTPEKNEEEANENVE